jgi:hypothetical protein
VVPLYSVLKTTQYILSIYQTVRRHVKEDHNCVPEFRQNLKFTYVYSILKSVFQSKSVLSTSLRVFLNLLAAVIVVAVVVVVVVQ